MPARFNAYVPDSAALVRLLEDDKSYRIGRSAECEVRVDHWSISRFHAELSGSEHELVRCATPAARTACASTAISCCARISKSRAGSRSATSTAGSRCSTMPRPSVTAPTAKRARATSRALSQQLVPALGIRALIPQTLDVVLELAGLDRGFVLYSRRRRSAARAREPRLRRRRHREQALRRQRVRSRARDRRRQVASSAATRPNRRGSA